ncbi:thiamine phosphate synthase [Sphingorhabdus sp. Alg239-R122]|uniref:thiamine phosphate synthase n=1 Tax=Sphingorhabdus sp. Alg239-R122 TaxID=2305989 RepID=UPI0013DAD85E|nr:thiamine phosphate synthase [Sphingorhabdus sp. Alg239-R122]
MPSCQKKLQQIRENLPRLWLLTDARNDAVLEKAMGNLPKGSGIIFRHYHMQDAARYARFQKLQVEAEGHGHIMILSGDVLNARQWNAGGIYGPPDRLIEGDDLLKLATVHDKDEMARADNAGVDAVFISPVFPTRSHVDTVHLGVSGLARLAKSAPCPAIALGGMTAQNYAKLPLGLVHGWAAIDGLSRGITAEIKKGP